MSKARIKELEAKIEELEQLMPLSDVQLKEMELLRIELIRESKIDELLECHYKIKTQALSITKDKNNADDLAQKTYEKALNNLDKYVLGSNACGWLTTMLHRLLIDGTRKKSTKVTDLYGDWTETQLGTKYSSEDKVIRDETQNKLSAIFEEAIKKLPDRLRDVFLCYYVKEMDKKDIGLQLSISMNEVKCRIDQSLDYLKFGILKKDYEQELQDLQIGLSIEDESERYNNSLFPSYFGRE